MENLGFKEKLLHLKKLNVAIIGHMGAGKSIIGKTIANKLNTDFFDTDSEIIKVEKKSINSIFKSKGENYFRDLESKIVLKLLNKKNSVISLGGGSILRKEVREKLKSYSVCVFLDINLIKLVERLKKSKNRPLLENTDILTKLKELDSQRRKYYLMADIRIQNKNSISKAYNNFINIFSKLDVKN